MENEIDKVSYSLGADFGARIKDGGMDSLNLDAFRAGLDDSFYGDSLKIPTEESQQLINGYFSKIQQEKMGKEGEQNAQIGKQFLEENAAKEGVLTLPSGIQYKVITAAEGPKPGPTDNVTVHYTGTLINGTVFDSSVKRGEPASFPLDGVIRGWTESLQLMSAGAKWMLYIPSDMAYGPSGNQGIGPNETLMFEVELLSIGN